MKLNNKALEELLDIEWLETNGQGGYASSSITGANTRKYHGLLVAPFNPPTERRVLVSKVEERVKQGDAIDDISVNLYPNTSHPKGEQFLVDFERRPISRWNYENTNWKLSKKTFMVQGSNTTVVCYMNTGKSAFEIELHPLFEDKDYHSTFHENSFDYYYEHNNKKSIKIHSYPDSPALYFSWSKGGFQEHRAWYKDIQLSKEAYRGQDAVEDYYRIGFLNVNLKPGESVSITFTTDADMVSKRYANLEKKATSFDNSLSDKKIKSTFYNDLLKSGNQFIVDRASTKSKTIIAGYHWFTDWGRDTMIAMRGLTIAAGDQKTSKSILSTFFKYLDQGMLPNRFPDYDGQEVEYNTIDATLWLFVTLYEYYIKFGDRDFIKSKTPHLALVLAHHIDGTRYNIHLTDEGFISGGEDGWQLTWMDARVEGYVVTPRIGCPVEINALWYNALCIYEFFCKELNKDCDAEIIKIKKTFKKNFKTYFLNEEGYLNDVVISKNNVDDSFRPNQIYAVSLPFSLLNKKEEKTITNLISDKLLTDYGLRTLNIENEHYIGHYGGNQWSRDTAYHQGTVWPFLLMEYWEAYLKVNNYQLKHKKIVVDALKPLQDHFYSQDCIHAISEIFDGEHPNQGRGCVQQAWSVAALVKLYASHELHAI